LQILKLRRVVENQRWDEWICKFLARPHWAEMEHGFN